MEKVIILRYGELHLKGKNRGFFEKKLIDDIKFKLSKFTHRFIHHRGRYVISDFLDSEMQQIIGAMRCVFGLHSLSVAQKCPTEIGEILRTAVQATQGKSGSFKVSAHRADKRFEYNSVQLATKAGSEILLNNPALRVDLHNPELVVNIDIREEGHAFVFADAINCSGGMPLGSSGRGLLLLSGGIDSPVAGYMMQRRGLTLEALHFHSYPYTNEQAQKKVEDLAAKLACFSNKIVLNMVKLTKIQEEIKRNCDEKYSVIMLRMIMMRVSEMVAKRRKCECLVNGESLGQVASQTLESLVITDKEAKIPVFRPLIGMDKQEIIEISKQISAFETSILPFEDCCTVFLPRHPITRPDPDYAQKQLAKIENLDELINIAVDEIERKTITSCDL